MSFLSRLTFASEKARFGSVMRRVLLYDREFDHRQDLQDIMVAYAALTARMVQLDWQTLAESEADASVAIDLASERYLRYLAHFGYQHGSHFWSTLQDTHEYDSNTTITAMIVRFSEAPGNGFEHLKDMLNLLMSRSLKVQGLLPRAIPALEAVNRMMQHYGLLQENSRVHAKALLDTMPHVPAKAYRLFELVDSIYQAFITKQVPALNHSVNQEMIIQLSCLLSYAARADRRVTASICRSNPGITDDLITQFGPVVAECTWRLLLFRKCLTEGRMELRVQGVEYMQTELVNLYSNHIKRDIPPHANPLGQYIADLLLANKVVEYLVGVDSHPQLISRSANIVGFLVITHRYRNAETDAIWRSVTSTHDSRTVDAILSMINGFLNLAEHEPLLYLTTKLKQLPLQSFDSSMTRYGVNLMQALRRPWKNQDTDKKMDMPPYELCMRLMREAVADDSLPLARRRELNAFGALQLQQLLPFGPSEADMKIMYEDCIGDIRSRSRFATGSVCVINSLLGQDPEGIIRYLADNYAITGLVVEDLAYNVDKNTFSDTMIDVDEHLLPRLDLLEKIIRYAPDSLDSECGQRLWDSTLGRHSLHWIVRDKAWIMLVKAILSCSSKNSFLDRCITVYLPKLDPPLFATQHSLAFVEEVIRYESYLAQSAQAGDEQLHTQSGTALLWLLSSVVPSGTIERDAIHKLVALYLDSPQAKASPRAAMEAMYVEVVDRCISQLTSAASKLKSFSDGTSSGEDEPMVVVVSDEEIQMQRLSFSRSLLILNELVQGAKSLPIYSPPCPTDIEIPADAENLKGEPLEINYQAFSGGVNNGVKSMKVGDLETISELRQRLVQLTGFEDFTIIARGFQLDLEGDAEQTLRDTNFEQKGLLIVKKAHDDSAVPEVAPTSELMPLQREIMKHFAKLYPLLDVEDELAKEVCAVLGVNSSVLMSKGFRIFGHFSTARKYHGTRLYQRVPDR